MEYLNINIAHQDYMQYEPNILCADLKLKVYLILEVVND